MESTIDKAGRVVIPKALRDLIGLIPGRVELTADGAAIRIEPVRGEGAIEQRGRLVIPPVGEPIDDEDVRRLRDADQR